MASREELLKIALQGVRTKGTGGRTLDITQILPGISAEDWFTWWWWYPDDGIHQPVHLSAAAGTTTCAAVSVVLRCNRK